MQFEKNVTFAFNEVVYHMSGIINELSRFGTHSFPGATTIHFYFEDIEMINSTGILNLINWMKLVIQQNIRILITYNACPKVVVDQMNKVTGFLPEGAIVRSFDVPFFCEECGKNYSKLISLGKEYTAGTAADAGWIDLKIMNCPKCNIPMEYDFISDKYFKFLAPLLQKRTK